MKERLIIKLLGICCLLSAVATAIITRDLTVAFFFVPLGIVLLVTKKTFEEVL